MRTLRTGAVLAAATLTLALADPGPSGGSASADPPQRTARSFAEAAALSALNSRACAQAPLPATIGGPPPAAFTSILGVLRRAQTASDAPPTGFAPHLPELYTESVRFAQTAAGERWYVWVAGTNFGPPADVARCLSAQRAALRREEHRIPDRLRAAARRDLEQQIAGERRVDAAPAPGVGIWLFGYDSTSGGGGGGASAAEIRTRGLWTSQGGGTGADPGRTTFAGVLPDGVASVTVSYPAGPLGGFSKRHGPALSVTAPVVGNVAVLTVERAGMQARLRGTTTWNAPDGSVIATFRGGP